MSRSADSDSHAGRGQSGSIWSLTVSQSRTTLTLHRFCHLREGYTGPALINEEGQALLEDTPEFDYLTHIVLRWVGEAGVSGDQRLTAHRKTLGLPCVTHCDLHGVRIYDLLLLSGWIPSLEAVIYHQSTHAQCGAPVDTEDRGFLGLRCPLVGEAAVSHNRLAHTYSKALHFRHGVSHYCSQ